jgi:beta-glucanase (GH16 family)/endo-1,4-beta-D-glucanase Y
MLFQKKRIHLNPIRFFLAILLAVVVPLTAFAESTANASDGGFSEELNSMNSQLWYTSDGWKNGDDFGNGWRADHVEFKNGIMALRLDDQPCPSGCSGKSYASGEYAINNKYSYGRVETRMKVAKGDGLVTSLFTYSGPTQGTKNDEIDIEILGKDTTKMETNYYTNGVGEHSTVIKLGFDAAENFHDYAFEWSPTAIKWYVDGVLVHTETGQRGPLPTVSGNIMVNLWPGAGAAEEWTKPFVYSGSPIRAYYDWIKFTPADVMQTLRPFPQHTKYVNGVIKPNYVSQQQLDNDVSKKYDEWKNRYLKKHPKKSDQYYVFYNLESVVTSANAVSCSEGHGYGMMITSLMAGYDSRAKEYFDGLFRFYKAHPSINNSALMAWQQIKTSDGNIIDTPESASDNGNRSATDGDMDIAYGLLLADKQWGSSGKINYRSEAKAVINAIMAKDINPSKWSLKFGDWVDNSDADYGTATRPSDFMLSHLKVFQKVSGDANWAKVSEKTYSIINSIVSQYSPSTGLLPDFVVMKNGKYAPAPANLLETDRDGYFSWNAARTPWRIPVDYLISGDKRAMKQIKTMNKWIQSKTKGDPKKIMSGYKLNGTDLKDSEGKIAYSAPFAVSAMVESGNQKWLNALWKDLVSSPTLSNTYYGNSIRLLCMITVSGNWWTP